MFDYFPTANRFIENSRAHSFSFYLEVRTEIMHPQNYLRTESLSFLLSLLFLFDVWVAAGAQGSEHIASRCLQSLLGPLNWWNNELQWHWSPLFLHRSVCFQYHRQYHFISVMFLDQVCKHLHTWPLCFRSSFFICSPSLLFCCSVFVLLRVTSGAYTNYDLCPGWVQNGCRNVHSERVGECFLFRC